MDLFTWIRVDVAVGMRTLKSERDSKDHRFCFTSGLRFLIVFIALCKSHYIEIELFWSNEVKFCFLQI